MNNLRIKGDGQYFNGAEFEVKIDEVLFSIIGDKDAPRLSVQFDRHPNQIDSEDSMEPLIYTDETFLKDLIQYFKSEGVPEMFTEDIGYSEYGQQVLDDELNVVDFDIGLELAEELEKRGIADADYDDDEDEDDSEDEYEDDYEDDYEEEEDDE